MAWTGQQVNHLPNATPRRTDENDEEEEQEEEEVD